LTRFVLNASQLICPLPVIRTQERISDLADNDELEVHATDPGALHDIPAWCRIHGHIVLSEQVEEDRIVILIRVQK